jgi:hypothetical protein
LEEEFKKKKKKGSINRATVANVQTQTRIWSLSRVAGYTNFIADLGLSLRFAGWSWVVEWRAVKQTRQEGIQVHLNWQSALALEILKSADDDDDDDNYTNDAHDRAGEHDDDVDDDDCLPQGCQGDGRWHELLCPRLIFFFYLYTLWFMSFVDWPESRHI